jgi:putative ABC transport system substrate-binding protein
VNRRKFVAILAGLGLWPSQLPFGYRPGYAQGSKVHRIGVLFGSSAEAPNFRAFIDELEKSGFVEGRNFTVDRRGFSRPDMEFADVAPRLVEAGADAILCSGYSAIRAARQATTAIPIIAIDDDMLANGFVRSLAHPGGNVTGVSIFASELDQKRQEILMELMPSAHRMAALADPNATPPDKLERLQAQARARVVELSVHPAGKPDEIAAAVHAAKAAGATALNVLATPLFAINRKLVIETITAAALPAIYQWPEMAEQGGLAAYGPRNVLLYRQMARQAAKVFKGGNPADIPVEQPTRFELVINLKTAKALGLIVPPALLARADEVIE